MMTKTIHINGIMCGHCEMRVKKALEALPFIESAQASHDTGTAVVTACGDIDETAIKNAVTEAGYTYVSMD